ncbi:diguanylate cyclase [Actinotalea sp. BY-33]|uniref:Diguanylate cyclase n=1 Tax=Actinotalea soli TaxID=2819234 RepID=A0A939LQU1_9CELL|nr:diguanylate cyclase [Actinotalea soli]MBO1752746.1 diguanylate cyclase [Actinotalea soli]
MTEDQVYALLYLAAGTVGLVVAGLVWRVHRRWPAPRYLAFALAASSVWALGSLSSVLVADANRSAVVTVTVFPSVAMSVGAFLCMLSAVADRSWRPGLGMRRALVAHPAVMLLLGATNDLHHLVLAPSGTGDGYRFALLFWVHTAYSYGLVVVGVTRVVRARRHAPALRDAQLTIMLAAGCVPGLTVAAQIGYMVAAERVVNDLSPVAFLIAGLIDAHAVLRRGTLKVLPIARAQVLDHLGDVVVVRDDSGQVIDLNLAARRLLERLGAPPDREDGAPPDLGPLAELVRAGSGEHLLDTADGPRVLDVRSTPLTDPGGRSVGTVLVARDVTVEVTRRVELAHANDALREHVEIIEQLRAEVAEQAVRDAMTGLHNRRHLDGALADLAVDLGAGAEPASVIMLDADHFKQVNDEHGHAVGDRLLAEIARVMADTVRPGETVARYGGEEFVVVLPATGAQEAWRRAEELRRRCARVEVPVRGGGRLGVTVSAGVTTSDQGRTSASALLDAADAALYEAKRQGRARTCASPAGTPVTLLARPRARA